MERERKQGSSVSIIVIVHKQLVTAGKYSTVELPPDAVLSTLRTLLHPRWCPLRFCALKTPTVLFFESLAGLTVPMTSTNLVETRTEVFSCVRP